MKEATGELNNTVIVVIIVSLLVFFFFSVIWPLISKALDRQSNCANAVCDVGYNNSTTYSAHCYDPQDSDRVVFECPYRG